MKIKVQVSEEIDYEVSEDDLAGMPREYQWVAFDEDGSLYAYNHVPYAEDAIGCWVCRGGLDATYRTIKVKAVRRCANWKDTLREIDRPRKLLPVGTIIVAESSHFIPDNTPFLTGLITTNGDRGPWYYNANFLRWRESEIEFSIPARAIVAAYDPQTGEQLDLGEYKND